MYKVVINCAWKDKSWKVGGQIKEGEVPSEVIDVLLNRTKAIVLDKQTAAKPQKAEK